MIINLQLDMPYKRMAFKTGLNSGYFSTSELSFDKLKLIN